MPYPFRKIAPPKPALRTEPAAAPASDPIRVQAPDAGILDQYVRDPPSAQNVVDLFENAWTSRLPEQLELRAGRYPTFADDRIEAVLTHLDGVDGYKILELGPLEGGHTYMLHEAGATVTAIESSSRSFLKCADPKIERMFLDPPETLQWRERSITMHPRAYREALGWTGFCGGPESSANWLERDDLMSVLTELGLVTITVLAEDVGADNGPAILLCAEH